MEGMKLMAEAEKAFLEGDMKGTNVILPLVATDLDELLEDVIRPFEEAGYTVTARFRNGTRIRVACIQTRAWRRAEYQQRGCVLLWNEAAGSVHKAVFHAEYGRRTLRTG